MENPPKRKSKKNKQGYTVSVNYFLKKDKGFIEKFFNKENPGESPKFPVYIRVVFLQQTVGTPSRLNVRLSEAEFENYFQRQDVRDFVDIERAAVLRSVEEFKPETIENVNISQWTKYYNESNITLKECAEKVMLERFRADIKLSSNIEEEDMLYTLYMMSASLLSLKVLDRIGLNIAQVYYKKYKTIFEIDNYNKAILDTAEFTLWHWKLGSYQAAIRKVHGSAADEFLNVMTDLLADYQSELIV